MEAADTVADVTVATEVVAVVAEEDTEMAGG